MKKMEYSIKELCDLQYKNKKLVIPLGYASNKKLYYIDLEKMSGLFIAGATGTGKSVFIDDLPKNPKYKTDSVCITDPIVKFNVNTASEEEMKEVGGIGSAIAKAIVTYRSGGNTFKRIEDIKNVSGIGNATFEKLKNIIRLRDE